MSFLRFRSPAVLLLPQRFENFQTFNDHIEEFTPKTKLALVNINWCGTFDSDIPGTFESDTGGTIKVMLSHQVVTKKLSLLYSIHSTNPLPPIHPTERIY